MKTTISPFLWLQLVFLMTGLTVSAQIFLPARAYMHLAGRIDDKCEATFNLIKIGDSLYGDLVFSDSLVVPQVLAGSLSQDDGIFRLQEPFTDSGTVFTGKFHTRQSMTGEILNSAGKVISPFLFVETFSSGSMPLQVFFLNNQYSLIPEKEFPFAEISQCLAIPGASGQPVLDSSVRSRIMSWFDPSVPSPSNADTFLLKLQERFFSSYLTDTEGLIQEIPDAGPLNWVSLKFMHILYNDQHLLSFYLLSYTYTGGAHGMELQEHHILQTQTGKEITLDDIFLPGYEENLARILTTRLKQSSGIGQLDKLTDHGFFVDEVPPTSNVYLTPMGIGFYYNHYEIAPYANGPTNILIPFTELDGMIKPSGVMARFLP